MSKTFDVIIIGGGIMGCCSALQLSRRGMKVALLEMDNIGAGPTGKSSAIIRQHYSNEVTARMALHSLRVFQDFENQVGDECGFTQTGFVAVVPAKDRAGLEANIALQQSVGIRTELLATEALREMMPGLATADLVAAVYEAESGYADPYLTVTALARAARRAGTTIVPETQVTGIRFANGKVIGVDTVDQRFDAPKVVNCAGAWAARVAAMAGVSVPINSCRVQVAFFRRPAGHEAPHPVFADFINATYFRSETGNLTLVGLIDPSEAEAIVNPNDYIEGVDDEFVLEAGEGLVKRYPAMERSQHTGGYASLYAITPDWHPIIDELPAGSCCYICSGFSGHGFKLGPAVGQIMADLVTGDRRSEFDPHLFRFGRFAENDPVRGQYEYSIVG
ncbi:MAG: FAD-binding oxidoreductase [Anaerolineaceae bacterium]|nr:MAG: FAD-binding oxidoreductase [Anaerolineaceae bacterium]